MSEYFVKRGETVHGPFSFKQLQTGVDKGKLTQAEKVSETNFGPWITLGELFSNKGTTDQGSEDSLFNDLQLPPSNETTSEFRHTKAGQVTHQNSVEVSTESSPAPGTLDNKNKALSYIDTAKAELETQNQTPSQTESIVPDKARYVLHALCSSICASVFAIFCPLFCFIPMGLLYKHFQDKEEDLISYMYLGGGVVSALGSILFLGMAWQGSLKFGEQISNSATGHESNFFQDGWTHPVIWLLSDDETVPQNHKITRDRISNTQTLLKKYYKTYNHLPQSLDDVRFKALNKSKPTPKDEWGKEITLQIGSDQTSGDYKIISPGPDREMGTDDDLIVSGSAK